MRLGIFAKTFVRPSLEEVLDAVKAHGLDCVQFNMACAGLPSLPQEIPASVCRHIARCLAERGMSMAAVSGTFNMIHPDLEQRREGMRRLSVLAAACASMGTRVITLCTGTRDPDDMWRWHPDNDSLEAWEDLTKAMEQALDIAEKWDVTLAFEPEVANVVHSAVKARRLLDDFHSPRLKVVMDAANLFHAGDLSRMDVVLKDAFNLLGGEIVIAHAKDLKEDGAAGHLAAGQGILDYSRYLKLLSEFGFNGPLILHSLEEGQVDDSVAFLRGKLRLPRK
ncbi:MAG TPA: sugar phosphate isomerase/epimerase [Gemmataceae bacterium]|jgi:sugar phosphate isomerase/epimerase|nr:sugar phosphate isomerase/epimerase [Gemmataceae bacterium]